MLADYRYSDSWLPHLNITVFVFFLNHSCFLVFFYTRIHRYGMRGTKSCISLGFPIFICYLAFAKIYVKLLEIR